MIDDFYATKFHKKGYLVVDSVFSDEEIAEFRQHLFKLRLAGTYPGDHVSSDKRDDDPLKQYPRLMHPHRWDEVTRQWLLDDRLRLILTDLMGEEPYAAQTMVYFKPPGGRGTAPHQDNYYLRVSPGTCVAAWIALEDTDEENGCMIVVPGSQDFPIMCVVPADLEKFATSISVPLPGDIEPISVEMKAGDVLFFAGQLIHGSLPNTSKERFRAALVCHYVVAEAEQVSQIDRPVLRFDGAEVDLDASATGGECGVWVDDEDQRRIEVTGEHSRDLGLEEVLEQLNSNIWEEARAMKEAT